jgi:hypothetical protein
MLNSMYSTCILNEVRGGIVCVVRLACLFAIDAESQKLPCRGSPMMFAALYDSLACEELYDITASDPLRLLSELL